MWDFSIGRALGVMVKSAPVLVFRMVVYFGITLAYNRFLPSSTPVSGDSSSG